ncbi:MAG: hypothetical protein IJ756_09375 [Paludibacteraceae bacterium]|nr:hypothetical protein [Paludibacteraceae bacterium]
MKKGTIIVIALLSSMTFSNCAAKKTVVQEAQPVQQQPQVQQETETQRKIREAKEQAELMKAQNELELLQIQHEQAKAALNSQATLEAGARKLLIPCMKEALELETNNQMAAQGMSTGKERQELALKDANRNAIAELMTRLVGVIKNGIEDYTKDSDTKSLTREQQAQLEGICIAAGERAINELFKPGCREFLHEQKGTYGCYVALYVPTKQVMEKINNAVEVAELDLDKSLFRKKLQAELDLQAEKEREAKQLELEKLQQLKGQTQQ